MKKRPEDSEVVRVGYLLIDAWRAEAELFERDGKPVMAQRLRRMADRAEAARRVKLGIRVFGPI